MALREAQNSNKVFSIGSLSVDVITQELKAVIVLFYSTLNEQQRRLYAGLESIKIGHGGDKLIGKLLQINAETVSKGRQELIKEDFYREGTRKPGAGRPEIKKTPGIISQIERLLEEDTVGDPITGLKWTRKTIRKIATVLKKAGVSVSPNTVRKLMVEMHYSSAPISIPFRRSLLPLRYFAPFR